MNTIKEDWLEMSAEVAWKVSALNDALYDFEKTRIAIEKKLGFMPTETKEKMENLLADAESALMDADDMFSQFAKIGDLIDEELAS